MLANAKVKHLRGSAKKTRLVIELIKGKTVHEARFVLDNLNKRACGPLKKVIDSAFANLNSQREEKMLETDVFVSKVIADDGPMLKRYRAATMGRATPIRHRTIHIDVELDEVEREEKVEKTVKAPKVEKAPKAPKAEKAPKVETADEEPKVEKTEKEPKVETAEKAPTEAKSPNAEKVEDTKIEDTETKTKENGA